MKELSLNILDIAQNSITAKAKNISILLTENTKEATLKINIIDDGTGMSEETVKKVIDPFYTSRTTRKVGLGIPLLKMEAEMTGGYLTIKSELGKGTELETMFKTDSIDSIPLGEIVPTICTIIQGAPNIDYIYKHEIDEQNVELDTKEIRAVLGEEVSLAEFEVIEWIKDYLESSYKELIN